MSRYKYGRFCGMVSGMPKTSVYLPDDLAAAAKESGLPLSELVRRGLGAPAPDEGRGPVLRR